jgi:hypothetical protein
MYHDPFASFQPSMIEGADLSCWQHPYAGRFLFTVFCFHFSSQSRFHSHFTSKSLLHFVATLNYWNTSEMLCRYSLCFHFFLYSTSGNFSYSVSVYRCSLFDVLFRGFAKLGRGSVICLCIQSGLPSEEGLSISYLWVLFCSCWLCWGDAAEASPNTALCLSYIDKNRPQIPWQWITQLRKFVGRLWRYEFLIDITLFLRQYYFDRLLMPVFWEWRKTAKQAYKTYRYEVL